MNPAFTLEQFLGVSKTIIRQFSHSDCVLFDEWRYHLFCHKTQFKI